MANPRSNITANAAAQAWPGLTGKPDTSYNNGAAFRSVIKNYPDSDFLADDFVKSFDNKIRYNKPTRLWILGKVKNLLFLAGVPLDKIYECMEEE